MKDVFDDVSKSEDVAENKALNPQVECKVKVKRNRGLKRDIKLLVEQNPSFGVNEVFEALKSNSYGGDKPVSKETVAVTMSLLKKPSL